MTTYKSYAECKIANPDSEIVAGTKLYSDSYSSVFIPLEHLDKKDWPICNPADYCSSLKEFLEARFKLVAGDKIIGADKSVWDIVENSEFNHPDEEDCDRYILSASALNGGCKIPAKAEQWTIYNNTLPLCELTDEQAAMLFNAWRSGAVRQALNNSGFCDLPAKATPWFESLVYRIKPKSERELFIEAAINHGIKSQKQNPKQIFGELFDSGKFKLVIKDGE